MATAGADAAEAPGRDEAFEREYGTGAGTLRPMVRLLASHRFFRLLFFGQFVSSLGDFLTLTASVTLLMELTDSSVAVAGVLAAMAAPHLLLSPVTGPVADRFNRYRIMLAADVARAALAPLMLLVVGQPRFIWLAYTVIVLSTACQAFFDPARAAVRPLLVPDRRLYPLATSAEAMAFGVSIAVGGATAGLVVGRLGYRACFLVDAASYLVSASFVLRAYLGGAPSYAAVAATEEEAAGKEEEEEEEEGAAPAAAGPAPEGTLAMWRGGARYLVEKRDVLALVAIKCLENTGNGVMDTALPRMAFAHFELGGSAATTIGIANAMGGVGMVSPVLMRLVDPECGEPRRRRLWLRRSHACIAAGLALLVWSPHVAVFFLGATVWYAGGTISYTTVVTEMQLSVEDEFRGRVNSIAMLARIAAHMVGTFSYAGLTDGARLSVRQASWAAVFFPLSSVLLMSLWYLPWSEREAARAKKKKEAREGDEPPEPADEENQVLLELASVDHERSSS